MVLRRALGSALIAAALSLAATQGPCAGEPGAQSIFAGVYTLAQAERGRRIYPDSCGRCHGARLDGAPDDPDMLPAPPIGGAKFLRNWEGRTLAAVFEYSRATMPSNNPGFPSPEEYADLIAYMLRVSRVPAGSVELAPDPEALRAIEIRRAPAR